MKINTNRLIQLTKNLVAINSISTTRDNNGKFNENNLAEFIADYYKKNSINYEYITLNDGRKSVAAFKKGSSKKTVVIIAHHDTVGVEDYPSDEDPFNVDRLAKKYGSDFLYGRGVGDMKSGIAVGMELMKTLLNKNPSTNVIFISVPDEENNSAGILSAVEYLNKLKNEKGLTFLGSINVDCPLQDITQPDTRMVITGGTIGKLLPCFYVVGKTAHGSDPFEGINAHSITSALIKELEVNTNYSDKNPITGELTPPPTCLKVMDLKTEYSVQLPLKAYLYFNYLTYQENPSQVLEKMKTAASKILQNVLKVNSSHYEKYEEGLKRKSKTRSWEKNTKVYTFQDVIKVAKKNNSKLEQNIKSMLKTLSEADIRDKNLRIVEYMAGIAKLPEPFIVCFFSAPYYPSSYDINSNYIKSVKKTVVNFGKTEDIKFILRDFADGVSDMNYLQIDPKSINESKQYLMNNPLGDYEKDIDLNSIKNISMPIVDIGPYALNPHQGGEKVDITYTFTQLPKLLLEVIENLQKI